MFKKGQKVKCNVCGSEEKVIYDVAKGKWMAWCECPICGDIDDIFDWDRKAELEKPTTP